MKRSSRTSRAARSLSLIAPLVLAALAGCKAATDKPVDSAGGSTAGMASMSVKVAPIPRGSDYTAADVAFMQGMITHHAQALVMARMAPTHGASPQVARLCRKILISQSDEITLMENWLKDRNQPFPDPNDPHPMLMPGMLTPAQITQLDQSKDTTFDRLFLTGMIGHHEGALLMVKNLFATPGAGQASDIFMYASDVDTGQRAEIQRMEIMLNSPERSTTQ
jgi:uncharacterized protein (DUF305 family)